MATQQLEYTFFIDPAVIRSFLLPFLNFNDFRNLMQVSKEFAQILTNHDDQELCFSWNVNVGDFAVIEILRRYSEDLDANTITGSMIGGARGVNISSFWSICPQSLSFFSNNCKIIGTFLQRIGKGKATFLELPPEFDIQKLVLITNWCECPIQRLTITHSVVDSVFDFKGQTPMTQYVIHKSGCKELVIKLSEITQASTTFYLKCGESCEKISMKKINREKHVEQFHEYSKTKDGLWTSNTVDTPPFK